MGRTYDEINERLATWAQSQPVFFVATAPLDGDGHVNCSPKGNRDELRVLDDHRVAYVDQTGSGVETVAHLKENGRIVVMFCAFDGPPRIVRFHGRGRAVLAGSSDGAGYSDGAGDSAEFARLADGWPAASGVGVRSIIVVDVERIADSCGYGVPLMSFDQHRPTLDEWARRKGQSGIEAYWEQKNAASIDGLEGLPKH